MVAYADPADATAPATVIDLSVWDTEGDAKEAEAVARRLMQKLADDQGAKSARRGPAEASSRGESGDAGRDEWMVTRDGDKLALVFGAPSGSGNAVAAEVLKSWKVSR
jgi:hypothetical protein